MIIMRKYQVEIDKLNRRTTLKVRCEVFGRKQLILVASLDELLACLPDR
jgi:hypothetical protein